MTRFRYTLGDKKNTEKKLYFHEILIARLKSVNMREKKKLNCVKDTRWGKKHLKFFFSLLSILYDVGKKVFFFFCHFFFIIAMKQIFFISVIQKPHFIFNSVIKNVLLFHN